MNKEEVIKKIKDKSYIYVSASIKNLEYYHYTMLSLGKKSYLFDDLYLNHDMIDEVKSKIYVLLNLKEEKYIFIHLNLALYLNIEKVDVFKLKKHQLIDKSSLLNFLTLNYTENYIIKNKLEYSIKKEIIEVYPLASDNPVRITLFDNEVENIKYFDLETQKSIEQLDSIEIFSRPNKNLQYFIEYIEKENLDIPIYIENIDITKSVIQEKEEEIKRRYKKLIKNSKLLDVKINKEYSYNYKVTGKNLSQSKFKLDDNIKLNDYVIHLNYGIGIYSGIEIIDNKEYIKLKYLDQDKLYIPIENLSNLEKYYNQDTPTIYKLGTNKFRTKIKKIRKQIDDFIEEYIKIQSIRDSVSKKPYKKDSEDQKSFEDEFEFILTKDQEEAILKIKNIQESTKILDMLLCADAGFGKTEVAMRVMFKAIDNNYQTCFITPTTVLAQQQYERFLKRFENFPVNIQLLSSFQTESEKTKIKKLVKEGKVDILIGTHSLLSDTIEYKNLGLFVIDEEQKFGVKQKEMIKNKKNTVDILSITATPIPRTLNIAMLGLRDMLLIETAPLNRLPIKTEVITKNDEFIRQNILKELARDGQVFYITNHVKNMKEKVEELKKLLPSYVVVDYIHSKLPNKVIKDKLHLFLDNKFEVLVSSTIIENGVDIPNANTIFIEGFDGLGLSQIYQLRGRVGRSNRQGYCYLIKRDYQTTKAKQKLKQIDEDNSIFDKGIQLSMNDLRIRGAGELLGTKQHGIIEDFGYDIYLKLLKEAIKKHDNKNLILDPEINLEEKGLIDEEYIKSPERLYIYKRLLNLYNIDELYLIKDELEDRFGKIPLKTLQFLEYIKYRIYAMNNNITKLTILEDKVLLYIFNKTNDKGYDIILTKDEFKKRMEKYEKNNYNFS